LSRSNTVEIKSTLALEQAKELFKRYEEPVADRGINFKDQMHWPDQYVITWKDPLHFKLANWVYSYGIPGYYEKEFWEVEVSNESTHPVFILQKHPSQFKRKFLIFLALAVVSAGLWFSPFVPKAYIGLGWGVLFVIFFFRTFIFDDETTYCVRFLERHLVL
jgi:hypothetical protein